jgi:SNF2 family DNA or RNA helicase
MEQDYRGRSSPLFEPPESDETPDIPADTLSKKRQGSKKTPSGPSKRKRLNIVDLAHLAPSGGAFTNIPSLPAGQTVDNRFTLSARTKADALKNLLTGIPEEHQAVAKQDKKFLDDALKKFTGQGSCHAIKGSPGWGLRGMTTELKNYQVTGVSWMRQNEALGTNARGGILADAMGLGKTVMMIANIVNGLDDPEAETLATLICVPSSLMDQWKEELEKHIDPAWKEKHGLHIIHYYSKLSGTGLVRMLENSFIVLATHHDVRKSCSKVKFPSDVTTTDEREAWFAKNKGELRGLLHKVKWRRFVIDEV